MTADQQRSLAFGFEPAPAPRWCQSTANQIGRSWTCVIIGAPRTKKTHQQIVRNKATGQQFIVQSAVQTKWAKDARLQVQAAWAGRSPLICPVNVAALFFRDRDQGDLDNFLAGLLDVLQTQRKRVTIADEKKTIELPGAVLANDKQVKSHDGSRIELDRKRPRIEVTIHWAEQLEDQT